MTVFVEKWTEDQKQMLIEFDALVPQISTIEMARRLGISKNAVVGKRNRLGLPKRPSPLGIGVAPKPLNPNKLQSLKRRKKLIPKLAGCPLDAPLLPLSKLSLVLRTPIKVPKMYMDRTCQWIVSGDEHRRNPIFCDQPARMRRNNHGEVVPCSYCDAHAQVAYKPVAPLDFSKDIFR